MDINLKVPDDLVGKERVDLAIWLLKRRGQNVQGSGIRETTVSDQSPTDNQTSHEAGVFVDGSFTTVSDLIAMARKDPDFERLDAERIRREIEESNRHL